MKKSLSILFAVFFVLSANALELPYKRLKKTYETDYEKTLEKAELWMKLLPNNPAAYYYASLVHFENAQKQTVTRKKYLGLVKSLRYAKELEGKEDASFLALVSWDTLTPQISSFTEIVSEELKNEELFKLSAILDKKTKRFDWMEPSYSSGDLAENDLTSEDAAEIKAAKAGNKLLFGMPNGSENVPSHNPSSEQEMLDLINAERKKKGMEPFVWDEDLARAARYHAFDMGSQNYFNHDSHDRLGGKLKKVGGTFARIKAFHTSSFVNSENIAAGNEGAYDTYMQWYHSPGHYENMFNSASKKIGVGVYYVPGSAYGYYWVMCTAL